MAASEDRVGRPSERGHTADGTPGAVPKAVRLDPEVVKGIQNALTQLSTGAVEGPIEIPNPQFPAARAAYNKDRSAFIINLPIREG